MEFPADTFLVELLIALLVQIVIVGSAFLWKACMNNHAEPVAQADLEMGTVIGGEGIERPASAHWHLAGNDGSHHERDPDTTEDMASLQHGFGHGLADFDVRANRPEEHSPTVGVHLVSDHETIGASAPVVVDVSHTQQVEVLTQSINQALVVEGVDART